MPRIELISTPYAGRSVIASGQECINLYAEINASLDPQAPAKTTYYPTPGTVLFTDPNFARKARGSYRTSIGTAYYVVGQNVYFLASDHSLTLIGVIADRQSQIYFSDNGLVCVLVDGVNGYVIDLTNNAFGTIIDPNFYGADYVVLLDTFFIFNRPLTNQFFISASNASYGMLTSTAIGTGTITAVGAAYTDGTYENVPLIGGSGTGATGNIVITGGIVTAFTLGNPGQNYMVGNVLSVNAADVGGTGGGFSWTISTILGAFDPLDIAAKSGFNDPIIALASVHRELWLIGALTTEVWIGTGAADFFFQEQQGAYINHGTAAQYSIATMDVLVFFIMQDQQGNGIVVQGQGYDVTEISTPRVVSEFKKYPTLTDAIGFCFQIEDHAYYCLIFPIANKGWMYDLTTKQWAEWNWTDGNGNLNRPRANCCMFAYGFNLIGDFEKGQLLKLDINTFTDYAVATPTGPITRVRTFPHLNDNNDRVSTLSFDADMEVGTIPDDSDPQVSLSWSDDKGVSYGNPVMQTMGKLGDTLATISWNRLGQARDRVYKLSWSTPNKTALNGGFIERKKART